MIFNLHFCPIFVEFKEKLASTDDSQCGTCLESRAKSFGRGQENRTTPERVDGRKGERGYATSCCRTWDIKV